MTEGGRGSFAEQGTEGRAEHRLREHVQHDGDRRGAEQCGRGRTERAGRDAEGNERGRGDEGGSSRVVGHAQANTHALQCSASSGPASSATTSGPTQGAPSWKPTMAAKITAASVAPVSSGNATRRFEHSASGTASSRTGPGAGHRPSSTTAAPTTSRAATSSAHANHAARREVRGSPTWSSSLAGDSSGSVRLMTCAPDRGAARRRGARVTIRNAAPTAGCSAMSTGRPRSPAERAGDAVGPRRRSTSPSRWKRRPDALVVTPERTPALASRPMSTARTTLKVTSAAVDTVRRPPAGSGGAHLPPGRAAHRVEVDLPVAAVRRADGVPRRRDHGGDALRRARPPRRRRRRRGSRWWRSPSTTAPPTSPRSRCPCWSSTGVPVTLYVATDFVDAGALVPRRRGAAVVGGAARRGRDRAGRRRLAHPHPRAARPAPRGEIDDELDRSIELIGEHVGVRAAHFAYPKAVMGSPAADAAVRARFRSAAVAGTRANPYGAHRPVPARPLPDPGERRHALVPAQGRAAAWRSRTPPPRRTVAVTPARPPDLRADARDLALVDHQFGRSSDAKPRRRRGRRRRRSWPSRSAGTARCGRSRSATAPPRHGSRRRTAAGGAWASTPGGPRCRAPRGARGPRGRRAERGSSTVTTVSQLVGSP